MNRPSPHHFSDKPTIRTSAADCSILRRFFVLSNSIRPAVSLPTDVLDRGYRITRMAELSIVQLRALIIDTIISYDPREDHEYNPGASHLPGVGNVIRTVRRHLGLSEVSPNMNYRHLLNRGPIAASSP